MSEQFELSTCTHGSDIFYVDSCGMSERYVERQLHINALMWDDTGCQMLMVLILLCAELTGKPANLRSHKR